MWQVADLSLTACGRLISTAKALAASPTRGATNEDIGHGKWRKKMVNRNSAEAVVLHIPHASTRIPPSRRQGIILSDAELDAETLRTTDWFTDEIFQLTASNRIQFPVSRLVVDPERFSEDEREPQAKVGRGVIYSSTTHGDILRNELSLKERASLLDEYYYPHHSRLTAAVERAVEKNGRCLIIDCHSFPSKPLPYELDSDGERPDICIGADSFHTSEAFLNAAQALFQELGYQTSVNSPFSGSMVPSSFYQNDEAVESIMIEVNRSLYMDEKTGKRNRRFGEIRNDLTEILEAISNYFIGSFSADSCSSNLDNNPLNH